METLRTGEKISRMSSRFLASARSRKASWSVLASLIDGSSGYKWRGWIAPDRVGRSVGSGRLSGQWSIMAGLTNGRERPQSSSKFNLAPEVDSPFLRFRGSARSDWIRTRSASQKSPGPSTTDSRRSHPRTLHDEQSDRCSYLDSSIERGVPCTSAARFRERTRRIPLSANYLLESSGVEPFKPRPRSKQCLKDRCKFRRVWSRVLVELEGELVISERASLCGLCSQMKIQRELSACSLGSARSCAGGWWGIWRFQRKRKTNFTKVPGILTLSRIDPTHTDASGTRRDFPFASRRRDELPRISRLPRSLPLTRSSAPRGWWTGTRTSRGFARARLDNRSQPHAKVTYLFSLTL